MPSNTSVRTFFPGKTNSGHANVNSTPYKQASRAPSDDTDADEVQPKAQFGNPSGKTKASPLSQQNGVANGVGRGRKQP